MPERSHGKLRPSLPRLREVPDQDAADKPTPMRDAKGRFAPANGVGKGARWKHAITKSLGGDLDGEAGELGAEAQKLYKAFMRELPCDSAGVRSLVAARARAAVLAGRYARRAAQVGLDTEAGLKASSEAAKWDARAERLAVTSLDVSTRQAKAAAAEKPADAHAAALEVFGREGMK